MKKPKIISLKGLLSFQIMHELYKKDMYGNELAKVIGERKGKKLNPGTIYPALKRLKDEKMIAVKQDNMKKIYSLNKKGKIEYLLAKKLLKKIFKEIL